MGLTGSKPGGGPNLEDAHVSQSITAPSFYTSLFDNGKYLQCGPGHKMMLFWGEQVLFQTIPRALCANKSIEYE